MTDTSGDPVPSVPESQAQGDIADLYDDIRRTLGVPVVNLIWRNLAAIPGGLTWCWRAVRPLYEAGAIHAEARALRDGQRLPRVPILPGAALRATGLAAPDEATVRLILETYHRSNPLNLVALCALLARLHGETAPLEARPTNGGEPEAALAGALPELLALRDMDDDTAGLVQAVNRLGARGHDHILVSMPRHLAHWPGFLALYWTLIAPYDADGRLAGCIDAVLADGRSRGARLAGGLPDDAPPDRALRQAVEPVLEDFCRHAIARMIPVVGLLKQAMPPSD